MNRRGGLVDRIRRDYEGISVHESDDRLLVEARPEAVPQISSLAIKSKRGP